MPPVYAHTTKANQDGKKHYPLETTSEYARFAQVSLHLGGVKPGRAHEMAGQVAELVSVL